MDYVLYGIKTMPVSGKGMLAEVFREHSSNPESSCDSGFQPV
jgi:hypothetical protein